MAGLLTWELAWPWLHHEAAADALDALCEQHDVAVMVGPRRGDVQRAGSQRAAPVDAAQPVTGAERPDLRELGATADPGAAVRADVAALCAKFPMPG